MKTLKFITLIALLFIGTGTFAQWTSNPTAVYLNSSNSGKRVSIAGGSTLSQFTVTGTPQGNELGGGIEIREYNVGGQAGFNRDARLTFRSFWGTSEPYRVNKNWVLGLNAQNEYSFTIGTGLMMNSNPTSNLTGTTVLTIDTNLNTGIGTMNPIDKLHVKGNLVVEDVQPNIFLDKSFSGTAGLIWRTGAGGLSTASIKASNGLLFQGMTIRANGNSTKSDAVILTTNGNVGIGDDTASHKLSVAGTVNLQSEKSGNTGLRIKGDEALWYNGTYMSWGFGGDYNYFADDVKIGGGGSTAPDQKLVISGGLRIGNTTKISAGSIRWNGTNFQGSNGSAWINLDGSGSSVWSVSSGNAYFNSGDVGIGTTNPTHDLHVAGDIAVAGQVVYPSDKNLKENIANITNGLSTINQLSPKSYTHKTDKATEFGLSPKPQFGLIAQDVEKVLPEIVVQKALVGEDGEIFKGLDYEKLIPILVAAVKDLSNQNTDQQKEIHQLKVSLKSVTDKQIK